MAPGDAGEFVTVDIDIVLTCGTCTMPAPLAFPVVTDWRDRSRVARLRKLYPETECPACSGMVQVPTPVIVLRPGDPLAVLVCATSRDPEQLQVLRDHLTAAADEADTVTGPVASTDPAVLRVVVDRYTGIQLAGLDAAGQEWADAAPVAAWLAAMRTQHPWPPVVAATGEYLQAPTDAAAKAVVTTSPVLADTAWEPAVRVAGERTLALQESAKQRELVTNRLRRLARQRQAPLPTADDADLQHALVLLERMLAIDESTDRTAQDIRAACDLGEELVVAATGAVGPDHRLTLTAINDTAALLLDDVLDPAASTARARDLLRGLRNRTVRLGSPMIVDATTNLALAQQRTDRVSDADAGEAAIELLEDAVHLMQLFFPDRPERAVHLLGNLAALHRSRLTGEAHANVDAALAAATRAGQLADTSGALAVVERVTLRVTELNALAERAQQRPDEAHDQAVMDALQLLDADLAQLATHHAVRIKARLNSGSIALDLVARDGAAARPELASQARAWLTEAHEQTRTHAPDDATRVLATTALAGWLFRLGEDAGRQDARTMLVGVAAELADTTPSRLHHTVFANLARVLLVAGDWKGAAEALQSACRQADAVIARSLTPATQLAQAAAAGDLYQRLALVHTHEGDARAAVHAVESARVRWRPVTASPVLDPAALDAAIQARLVPRRALLYVGTSGVGTYAVLLVGGGRGAATTFPVTSRHLAPLLAGLEAASSLDAVAGLLDTAGDVLAGLIDWVLGVLRDRAVAELGIVSGGALTGLPLGALPGSAGSLIDAVSVEYLMSAKGSAPAEPVTAAASVSVVDPSGSLEFAATELQAVQRWAPNTRPPDAGPGVRGWLLTQLTRASHLHLACHARYDPADPFASAFDLGGGSSITLADLARVNMTQLDLVVASCCQTAVVDQRGSEEAIGLAQTLLAAGAARAVASLWQVDDVATSLVVARFYDRLAAGVPPAEALREAQDTVRRATVDGLRKLADADDDESWIPTELRRHIRLLTLHPDYRDPEFRPFEHPAHWAGLVYLSAA